MSSSEEDSIPQTVKCVKRRKRVYSRDNATEPVKLYSHKVMPAIKEVNQNILKEMNEELALELTKLPVANSKPIVDAHHVNDIQHSDEEVIFVEEISPIKPQPVTPPPERKTPEKISKHQSSIQRKRKKLLCNVASVVLDANHEVQLNQSLEQPSFPLDTSVDDDTCTFTVVKIRFQSCLYKYSHMKKSSFNEIFNELAKDIGVIRNLILLTLNDQKIDNIDTPESIGLSVADFIDCVIMDDKLLQENRKALNAVDCINIHFQCKFQKSKKSYSINKFDPFNIVMNQYADAVEHNVKKLRFFFDGELVDGSLTPQQLELENDYCVDVMRTDKKIK